LSSGLEARSVWQGSEPFASLNLPQFGKVYADGARRAGRINAAHISPEEHNVLLRERQALLDKMLAGTMTKKESNKLAYIRWSLDRIEDAKYGETLDQLESVVSEYEQLLSAIHALGDKLSGELGKGRRK